MMKVHLKFNIVAECDLEVTEDNYPGAFELDTVDEVLQHVHEIESENLLPDGYGAMIVLETVEILKGTNVVTLEVTVVEDA